MEAYEEKEDEEENKVEMEPVMVIAVVANGGNDGDICGGVREGGGSACESLLNVYCCRGNYVEEWLFVLNLPRLSVVLLDIYRRMSHGEIVGFFHTIETLK